MADRYQTQCPHCGVKFQITAQQLQLANGTVRCGSCLQVFQATQNMVPLASAPPAGVGSARGATARPSAPADSQATVQRPAIPAPPPAKPAAAPAAPKAPAQKPPAKPAAHADDDLADMILRELEQPAAKPAAGKPPAPAAPAATPANPAPAAGSGWGAPLPKPAAGSAAARYGIEENKTKISIGGELNEKLEVDDPFGVESTSLDEKDFKPEADESWAKALIGEKPLDEREERVRKFQITADELSIADKTGARSKSALAERIEQLATSQAPAVDLGSPLRRTAPAGGSQVDDEFDFLSDPGLTMQDVELPGMEPEVDLRAAATHSHQVDWGRDMFWGTLSVVMLLVLLAQYFAFNKDTLARDPSWHGMYQVACGALGCALPKDSDVSRIQGANLVIRSHPSVAHALVVDAVIYNRAPFAQPFPRLELGFSDAQGNPVAGRVFMPSEYLKGELAGAKSMPPDTPIHLSLEIVDPGPGALNYELRFLAPGNR